MLQSRIEVRPSRQLSPVAGHQSFAAENAAVAMGSRVTIPAGQTLFADGEAAKYCYKILSGGVRIVKLISDGRRQICEFALPGDTIGLEAGLTHDCSAEAVADTQVLRYSHAEVEAKLTHDPATAVKVCRILARNVEAARRRSAYICRMTAEEKIASFLLDLADRDEDDEDNDHVCLPMSRSDIGDYLGLATETVSRVLTRLRARKVIALIDTRDIKLLDRDALEDMRGGLAASSEIH